MAYLVLLLPVLCLGHLALWVAVFNWLHALPISWQLVKRWEKGIQLLTATIPLALLLLAWKRQDLLVPPDDPASWIAAGYLAGCLVAAVVWTGSWIRRQVESRVSGRLEANDTRRIDVAAELGQRPVAGFSARLLDRLPINEILLLQVHQKRLVLPQLAAGLEDLRIAHLSDLHYAGHIGLPYFQYVMDVVNQQDPDLIVVTGDIVDRTACLEWIAPTLGQLCCRYGKFFILGNHDLRVDDVGRLRQTLSDCGLQDLAGKWQRLEIRGEPLWLAGNERPWFDHAPTPLPPEVTWTAEDSGQELRILLAHTPDQFDFARQHGFDLMLAGHTHGGQIRLPLVGPVVAPSRHGVRYASGVFFEPPTLMHVSRGISGMQAIRWNCPPELAILHLTRGEARNDRRPRENHGRR